MRRLTFRGRFAKFASFNFSCNIDVNQPYFFEISFYLEHLSSDGELVALQSYHLDCPNGFKAIYLNSESINAVNNYFLLLQGDKSRGWSEWGNWGPCDTNCTKERERFCSAEDIGKCPGANGDRVQLQKGKCPYDECYGE